MPEMSADWPALLTQPQAWRYLGIGKTKWQELRGADLLPAPVKIPTSIRPHWRRIDLDKFIAGLPRHRGRGRQPQAAQKEAKS